MIAVLGATKSCPVKCEQQRPGAVKRRSHTSNIVPAWLTERIWCTQFQSSLLNIYSSPSGFQSSLLLIHFRYGLTTPKSDTEPIRHVTFHFRDRCGAASLRHKNRAPQPFLCVNRRPIRSDFRGGAKAIRTQAKTPRIQTILSLAPSGLRKEDGWKNTNWCLSTGFPNLVYVW